MTNPQLDIRQLAPLEVVAVAHIGPYAEMHVAFSRLAAWLDEQGQFGPDTQCLGIFHDDPETVPAAQLRSHACFALGEGTAALALPGQFEHLTISGGPYAVLIHRGPYARLGESYRWLFQEWLPASGRAPAEAPSFERYLDDPRDTPAEQLLTEICLPLR
ncbi:AraC family transcriptional regulator [Burkholderia gladioli]|uniref:AraC family transcriptional regulator n=1 Tax=Burkholderia gladioli TaxID=28095 RepID=UPI00163EAF94|nr:GyrI-like domain-containing protein [Burkholderia gladioli]